MVRLLDCQMTSPCYKSRTRSYSIFFQFTILEAYSQEMMKHTMQFGNLPSTELQSFLAYIAILQVRDTVAPETLLPQDEVISSFEFYAGLADKLERDGDHDLKVPDETLHIMVKREPLGVCALITPWNVRLHSP